MRKNAVELIRVSTESQAAENRASIPSQRAINRRTADAYGLTIVRSIEIAGVSGAAILLAPEMRELIQLMQDPEIHGVVAREFSRLMRPENFSDYALLQVFADTSTILYLPEGPIDFASDSGRIVGAVQAVMGGIERTQILKKVWNAKEEKRRNGGFAQSWICLPFGVAYPWTYTADAERVKEVFRLFLTGDTCYTSIGKKLGLEPYNVKIILQNPIYTGWRVIDKKRDLSPAGKYPTKDGRQGDRRKIQRAPEDVIRVKVLDPLISEIEFNQAQRIIERKRQRSWRADDNYEHRFTYNGFLNCAQCHSLIYTKYRRDDYYVCKQRCGTPYQRRDRLEPILDKLFTKQLTQERFLSRIARQIKKTQKEQSGAQERERLTAQLESLRGKRQRVLDGYFEGVISTVERDARLQEIERQIQTYQGLLINQRPAPELSLDSLVQIFAPFVEFDLLARNEKRALLSVLTPSIEVSDYRIAGLFIGLEKAHTAKGRLNNATSERIWLPIAA